jgi:hypothetical protein
MLGAKFKNKENTPLKIEYVLNSQAMISKGPAIASEMLKKLASLGVKSNGEKVRRGKTAAYYFTLLLFTARATS